MLQGSGSWKISKSIVGDMKNLGTFLVFYIFNESGRMDEDRWKEATDVFARVWEEKYPGLECCVQVDNLAAHKSVEETLKLLAKGIRFIWPQLEPLRFYSHWMTSCLEH